MSEKPDRISDRDWSIYLERKSGKRVIEIAKEFSLSQRRIYHICDEVQVAVWRRDRPPIERPPFVPRKGAVKYSNANMLHLTDISVHLFMRGPLDWEEKPKRC